MKKIILSLITISLAGGLVTALAQDAPGGNNPPPPPPATDAGPDAMTPTAPLPDTINEPVVVPGLPPADAAPNEITAATTNTEPLVILPATGKAAPAENIEANFTPPATGTNVDELRLNFRNAPLEMVLNYLSDAAGFIIVLDTRVNGNVSVISSHPMTVSYTHLTLPTILRV